MACADERQQLLSQGMKELLGRSCVVVQSAYKECNETSKIFSWRVLNYAKLKRYVLYYQLFENTAVKCVFKMFKTQTALYVCLRSGKIKNRDAQFSIIDEATRNSLITYTQELKDGLYVGDFRNDHLFSSDSTYLKDGIMTVSFRYVDSKEEILRQAALEEPDPIGNLDRFRNELKNTYLASLYSDFTIRAGDYNFDVHRFILCSRSKFFELYLGQCRTLDEYTIRASPRVVHEMLVYLYCGELRMKEMASMLEIYAIAKDLIIDSLSNKCLRLISEHINEKNFRSISALAEKLDSDGLRKIVDNYRQRWRPRQMQV